MLTKICALTCAEIKKFIISKSTVEKQRTLTEMVVFIQRFGSSLNLHSHFHIIALDGVYEKKTTGRFKFYGVKSPTDFEVAELINKISKCVHKYLVKAGYLYECDGEYSLANQGNYIEPESLHLPAMAASISHKIAFGENAGRPVKRLKESYSGNYWPANIDAELKSERCATSGGYSIHANTAIKNHQRERLEKLICYMARPYLAEERMEVLANDMIRIKLKSQWCDGTTHIELTPLEFIEKIIAIIPPPFFNGRRLVLQKYF